MALKTNDGKKISKSYTPADKSPRILGYVFAVACKEKDKEEENVKSDVKPETKTIGFMENEIMTGSLGIDIMSIPVSKGNKKENSKDNEIGK